MEWYATEVWGKRVTDDDALFENMNLQIFQAGLNPNPPMDGVRKAEGG